MSPHSNYASTIQSFYLAFYGRPADVGGLAFWSADIAANDGNLAAISADFANSAQARVRFADTTTAERIADIYQQLFNREPDAGGLTYWTDAVVNGKVLLADVSVSILNGARGS